VASSLRTIPTNCQTDPFRPKIALTVDSTESNNPTCSSEQLTQKKIAAHTSSRCNGVCWRLVGSILRVSEHLSERPASTCRQEQNHRQADGFHFFFTRFDLLPIFSGKGLQIGVVAQLLKKNAIKMIPNKIANLLAFIILLNFTHFNHLESKRLVFL
jgi:hypothetical protein